MEKKFTYYDKLNIIENISKINKIKNKKKYFYDIFNIIESNNVNYSSNTNGVFFNLDEVNDSILLEIEIYLKNIKYV